MGAFSAQRNEPDFKRLVRDFAAFTRGMQSNFAGQVTMVTSGSDCDDTLTNITLEIRPNDGAYKGGTFNFVIVLDEYPVRPPVVMCATPIYHPNIDELEPARQFTNICVNILDSEWDTNFTLLDVVQAVLFLFHNPNFEDPLSPYFDSTIPDWNEFANNVRSTLLGEMVDDWIILKRNWDESIFNGEGEVAVMGVDGVECGIDEAEKHVHDVPIRKGEIVETKIRHNLDSDKEPMKSLTEDFNKDLTFAKITTAQTTETPCDFNPLCYESLNS